MNISHHRTRLFGRRAATIAAAVLISGVPLSPAGAGAQPPTSTPFETPNTDACPQREVPPPPIDSSEVPRPGDQTPTPVPVPADAVGGPALAECGVITEPGAPPLPADISAAGWVLTDLDTGSVIAAKDPHGRYRPASTIKVLLALVALDELDLSRTVIATEEDAQIEGSAVGIGKDGTYTVRQLMQGLVMASGNDAAHAIARQLGGVDVAVEKMNVKARELGALDTRTASPSGLDGPGMACSPYDLALIFRAAMDNPTFAELVATESVPFPGYPRDSSKPENPSLPDMPGVPVNPDLPLNEDRPGFVLASDNALLFNYPDALGGKNGYTDDARQTFVGAAERGGRRLAVSLMNADVRPIRPWEQAARLLDYGFAQPASTSVGSLVEEGATSAVSSTRAPSTATPQTTPERTVNAAPSGGAYPGVNDDNDTAIRVGVGVVGLILVIGLVAWARSLTRRTP
ncbi:MAG: serine hydrolase [Rhodococcus sp. (in: high G+C Gram-positive bacteria)]